MKKLKYYLLFLGYIQVAHAAPQKKLLVLDTSGNSEASYSQLQALAESVDFNYSFANFYNPPTTLDAFDAVFLFMDPLFFQNSVIKQKSLLTKRIISLLKDFTKQENKLLTLLFPGKLPQTELNKNALCAFFNQLQIDSQLCTIMKDLGPCIFSTDEQRSSIYRTSLFPSGLPTPKLKKDSRCRLSSLKKLTHKPITLPVDRKNTYLQSVLPLGIYVKPQKQAALLLGADSSFKGAELEENMFFSPYDLKDREKLLITIQHTLAQLHATLITGNTPTTHGSELVLPSAVLPKKPFANLKKNSNPLFKKKITCAWMEIEPLENNWKTAVDYIKKSNVNLLWTSFNPEWFLSKQAIRSEKEFKKVTTGIQNLTKELAKKYNKQNQPTIFVGFDLTNNYSKSPVKHPVIDVYGKQYTKIPAPLDKQHFWQEEFIDPLKKFITHWKQHADNQVPIGGIFFDFEMYHAQTQAAAYNNLMDFSSLAWNLYTTHSKQPQLKELTNVKQRVNYLFKNKLFNNYFKVLEQEAKQLGIKLKQTIKQELP
ncbi:MAG: hypothetical protein ACJAZS_000552, partial [Alteromonas naphthalenivorans]